MLLKRDPFWTSWPAPTRRLLGLGKPGETTFPLFGVMVRTLLALLLLVSCLLGLKQIGSWTFDAYVGMAKRQPLTSQKPVVTPAREPATPPRSINIDIGFKNYEKLAWKRQLAFAAEHISQDDDSWVNAHVEADGLRYPVQMRLKGDITDHLEGSKWSYRIRLRGGNCLWGMKTFSIQDPKRSAYINEWVFHELMRREGIVAPRYDFIQVSINGEAKGIHALEESFSKELLEASSRREGPIVKFDETYLWTDDKPRKQRDIFFAAEVDSFQSKAINADPKARKLFEMARHLLEGFRDQKLPARDVFDIPKTATFFALTDLTTGHHATRWKNIRFYYNPATSLLEPIPYNAYGPLLAIDTSEILNGRQIYSIWEVPEWLDTFFTDRELYAAYVRELDRISTQEFLDRFLASIDGPLHRNLALIRQDDPTFEWQTEYLTENAKNIRDALHSHVPLRARFDPSTDKFLRVANTATLRVELDSVVDAQNNATIPFREPVVLLPRQSDVLNEVVVPLGEALDVDPAKWSAGRYMLKYHIVGAAEQRSAPVSLEQSPKPYNLREELARREKATQEFEGLEVKENRFVFKPGKWTVQKSLMFPSNSRVIAGPGVVIELVEGANFISFSPLEFIGNEESPVIVRSPDQSGGLAVISAREESKLEYVHIHGLTAPHLTHWEPTGATMFYESPLKMNHCRMEVTSAEDLLNIVRSTFALENSFFSTTRSDGVDIDFGTGTVSHCQFEKTTNDCLDVSQTQVTVTDCTMSAAGDKGISVGEASQATIERVKISSSKSGLVAKDLSQVKARDVEIVNCKTAFCAYRKKAEHGPGHLVVENATVKDCGRESLIEAESTLELNGRQIHGTLLHVAEKLLGESP